jgi:SNF2 family DNA or RNA helicase
MIEPGLTDQTIAAQTIFTSRTTTPDSITEPYLRQTAWDLIVIDEAHRLRNVYKSSSKIALAIKQAVAPFPKVLLTATPLNNSLLELYGLVSMIDDYAFGNLKSYWERFVRPRRADDCSGFGLRRRILWDTLNT